MSLNKRAFIQAAGGDQIPSTLANNFRAVEYTGTGSSNSITGLGFTPDLVVIRNINQADDWAWFNSSNPGKFTSSNNTNAEANFTFTFDYDGFTVPPTSGMTNGSGQSYVAFCWRGTGAVLTTNTDGNTTSYTQANTTSNFSIVKWTGTGSNTTIGHGLGTTPSFAIVKNLSDSTNWLVKNDAALGTFRALYLNQAVGEQTNGAFWNGGGFSSSIMNLGTDNATNGSGDNMIAYIWAGKSGFSNGNAQYAGNGTTQTFNNGSAGMSGGLSFVAEMCIVKSKDGGAGTRDWRVFWKANSGTSAWNGYKTLRMNTNAAAVTDTSNYINFGASPNYYMTINGSDDDFNASGYSYNPYAFG